MTPLDLILWALAALVFVGAFGGALFLATVAYRAVQEQRANLATHRARKAQEIAEARTAEQIAELEAANVLERRLALPLGGGSISKAEELEARLDAVASVAQALQGKADAMARRLATQSAQLAVVLEQRPTITHTSVPLAPRKEEQS